MKKIYNLIQCPSGRFTIVGWNLLVPDSLCVTRTNKAGQEYNSVKVWDTAETAVSEMVLAGIAKESIKISFNKASNVNH